MSQVAYFTPEIAIDNRLNTYVGGLADVSGSFLRAAFNSEEMSTVGVTILCQNGHYRQKIGPNGMEISYQECNFNDFFEDTGKRVKIQLGDNPNVSLAIKLLRPGIFKIAKIVGLDANLPENDELSKSNCHSFYPGDIGKKLAQMVILGIGGVKALEALQIPVDIYHLNEGYSFLATVELIRQKMAAGFNFQETLNRVKQQTVFTTHTPQMSGNEFYDLDLMFKVGCFPGFTKAEAISLGGNPFNNTVAAFRTAKRANAVSKSHDEIANRIWAWVEGKCEIVPITNGIDVDFWQLPEFKGDKAPEELRATKIQYQRVFFPRINELFAKDFRENLFTLVWARRYDEYKRPGLIFRDR